MPFLIYAAKNIRAGLNECSLRLNSDDIFNVQGVKSVKGYWSILITEWYFYTFQISVKKIWEIETLTNVEILTILLHIYTKNISINSLFKLKLTLNIQLRKTNIHKHFNQNTVNAYCKICTYSTDISCWTIATRLNHHISNWTYSPFIRMIQTANVAPSLCSYRPQI